MPSLRSFGTGWLCSKRITGTVLLIIFSSEESAKNLFVVLICHVISLLMIFCGKDTNLFSNFKILTKKNDQKNRPRDSNDPEWIVVGHLLHHTGVTDHLAVAAQVVLVVVVEWKAVAGTDGCALGIAAVEEHRQQNYQNPNIS